MRYICTLEGFEFKSGCDIIIKDTIDNEEYNIKDLDIAELDYIMGKGFADEVFAIQEYLKGKRKSGNRITDNGTYLEETIKATDKEGTVRTSHIIEDNNIEVETNRVIVNNRVRCYLRFNQQSSIGSVKIKLKASLGELFVVDNSFYISEVVMCDRDLLRLGKLNLCALELLNIEELNRNTPTKEVLTHITNDLVIKCERFSMLNLLSVPNAMSYSLDTDPYDIGEWLSKVCESDLSERQGKPICIHDKNKKIMEWFMSLENRKLKPTDISATTRETTLYKFEGTGIVEIELDIEEFDFANTVYLKAYKDMVVFVRVLRNTGTKQKYSYIANIHLHKKENIK